MCVRGIDFCLCLYNIWIKFFNCFHNVLFLVFLQKISVCNLSIFRVIFNTFFQSTYYLFRIVNNQ